MMKITCSEAEKEWLEKLMIESKHCDLDYHCDLLGDTSKTNMRHICQQCIEENVDFEIER